MELLPDSLSVLCLLPVQETIGRVFAVGVAAAHGDPYPISDALLVRVCYGDCYPISDALLVRMLFCSNECSNNE